MNLRRRRSCPRARRVMLVCRAMSTRRQRAQRPRKPQNSEVPQTDVAVTAPPAESVVRLVAEQQQMDPTQTGQLRALEAGWDELLS